MRLSGKAGARVGGRAVETHGCVIEARGLVKRFGGHAAVDGIELAVPAGGCLGLLGPNGAGKTTTLRLVLGQALPDAGTLRVLGEPVPASAERARARMGVVPQGDTLDPDFTVEENLRVYARYFGLRGPAVERRIRALLEFAELTGRAGARVQDLSGGMRRRLAMARALVNDPELVVLDEPTTGLDPQVRHHLWARLRELVAQGRTLLLTTHYMEEAERLCERVVIMDRGRILDQGSPAELVARHVEPEVVEIRGAPDQPVPTLPGTGACRIEQVGDVRYCYTADARPLLAALEGRSGLTFVHRPAGLEDVFLRLTGRELRE